MTDIVISDQLVTMERIDRPQPVWSDWTTSLQLLATDIGGTLSGTVKLDGVLQANAPVSVYYRKNGKLISRIKTDINGAWQLTGLDRSVSDYYAVAQTDSAFNSIVYDKLTPL